MKENNHASPKQLICDYYESIVNKIETFMNHQLDKLESEQKDLSKKATSSDESQVIAEEPADEKSKTDESTDSNENDASSSLNETLTESTVAIMQADWAVQNLSRIRDEMMSAVRKANDESLAHFENVVRLELEERSDTIWLDVETMRSKLFAKKSAHFFAWSSEFSSEYVTYLMIFDFYLSPSQISLLDSALHKTFQFNNSNENDEDLFGKKEKITLDKEKLMVFLVETQVNQQVIGTNVVHIDEAALTQHLDRLELTFNNIEHIDSQAFVAADARFQHVLTLCLNDNEIATLNPSTFAALGQLKSLDLDFNCLELLADCVFEPLVHLEHLKLSNNSMRIIEPKAFAGLGELRELSLFRNRLVELDSCAFARLARLDSLNLAYNLLVRLNDHLFHSLANLTTLTLNNNQIARIEPEAFAGLGRLSKLDLERNQISCLCPHTFSPLKNLKALNLNDNQVQTLDMRFVLELEQLEDLSLRSNRITELVNTDPTTSTSTRSVLKKLDLFKNQLRRLADNVLVSLCNLELLDLRDNELAEIEPNAWSGLEWLKELHLDNNQIYDLSASFGTFKNMPNLAQLSLFGNHVKLVPERVFEHLDHLSRLNLGCNEIVQLESHAFSGLDALVQLDLSSNKIEKLDADVFANLTRLKELNLTSNCIQTLHAPVFDPLGRNLLYLGLARNKLTQLTGDLFAKLVSLRTLDLSNNQLVELSPNAFAGLAQLDMLRLSRNRIERLPDCVFSALINLEVLSLDDNRILDIQSDDLAAMTSSLQELDLRNNTHLLDRSLAANSFFAYLKQLRECYL